MKKCFSCELRETCTTICEDVEKQLPRLETKTIYHELSRARKTPEFIHRKMEQIYDLLNDRDVLVGELRKVFDLVHNEGRTFLQIKKIRRYVSISSYNVYQKALKVIELRRAGISEGILREIMDDFNKKLARKKAKRRQPAV
ncbi:MAG: hypothetical protein NUW37_18625 [Planctomycetes bacterium]|nr:hypothetical protein [Planctomycetota bacterium]